MRLLSCGQIEPLWSDMGLNRDCPDATVRMPRPEKNCGPKKSFATCAARSAEAIPVNKT